MNRFKEKMTLNPILTFLVLILAAILLSGFLHLIGFEATYNKSNLLEFLISFLIFLVFTKIKIKHINIINMLASTTFWVYLIHDNYIIRSFIRKNIFKTTLYQNSNTIIIYSILVVIFVFLICSTIDLIRQFLLERPIFTFFDKHIFSQTKNIENSKVLKKIGDAL